jgi:hypothetical protein
VIALSGGLTNLYGEVINTGSGRFVTTDGSTTVFLGAVTRSGPLRPSRSVDRKLWPSFREPSLPGSGPFGTIAAECSAFLRRVGRVA